jgi:DNA-directed RNA polymerase specialized sigma24 family protein
MQLTEEQIKVIEDVMMVLNKEITFDIYDEDDMAQEIFLICAKLTEKYDESKGAYFPYLLGAARNRVISFTRKHYGNLNSGNYQDRIAIRKAVDISNVHVLEQDHDVEEMVEKYAQYISDNISPSLREDFMKMREGIKLPYPRRTEILEYVRNCMDIVDEITDDE